MADMSMKSEWNLKVNIIELRLILKALGGRLNNEDEVSQAKELGDRLTESRAKAMQQGLADVQRLLEAVNK